MTDLCAICGRVILPISTSPRDWTHRPGEYTGHWAVVVDHGPDCSVDCECGLGVPVGDMPGTTSSGSVTFQVNESWRSWTRRGGTR